MTKVPSIQDQWATTDVVVRGDTASLQLWFPEVDDNPRYLEVGLMDTRGADPIRISYDFDRDGWKIEQASTFSWDSGDKICDMDWQEVAFIKAWGREVKEQPE